MTWSNIELAFLIHLLPNCAVHVRILYTRGALVHGGWRKHMRVSRLESYRTVTSLVVALQSTRSISHRKERTFWATRLNYRVVTQRNLIVNRDTAIYIIPPSPLSKSSSFIFVMCHRFTARSIGISDANCHKIFDWAVKRKYGCPQLVNMFLANSCRAIGGLEISLTSGALRFPGHSCVHSPHFPRCSVLLVVRYQSAPETFAV